MCLCRAAVHVSGSTKAWESLRLWGWNQGSRRQDLGEDAFTLHRREFRFSAGLALNMCVFSCFSDITWCSEEAMGSCLSCPEKESIPDNHQSKFKVSSCLGLPRQRPRSQSPSVSPHPGLFTNDCGWERSVSAHFSVSKSVFLPLRELRRNRSLCFLLLCRCFSMWSDGLNVYAAVLRLILAWSAVYFRSRIPQRIKSN